MLLQVESVNPVEIEVDWLIATIAADEEFHPRLKQIDDALDGALTRLRERDDLNGKCGDVVVLPDVPGLAASRLLIVGLGKPTEIARQSFDKAVMTAARTVTTKGNKTAAVLLNSSATHDLTLLHQAEIWATGLTIAGQGQSLYKTEPDRHPLKEATLLIESDSVEAEVKTAAGRGRILGDSVNVARELIDRGPDEIYPETFARRARQMADEFESMNCEVWGVDRLEDENMGSMLAVARGSDREPRLVILEYFEGGPNAPTLALVGKGVTFDSGGYSLKTSDGMIAMKSDMSGAASVLGAMSAIAELGLKVNVIGLMGLVENLISGKAYKLGDVLTARNGKTIEVHNTDAEGRLVLADVLCYASERCNRIIDLATLTGACMVALGTDVAGVFANNQSWCDRVIAGARNCGEPVWQMPMFDDYNELLKSDVADLKNIGGRWGGAVTAAKFLENFVNKKPWVHLDIAGPAFADSNKPHREGGATGALVRTLVEVASHLK